MGFFLMVISMLLGIFFIAIGVCYRKSKRWYVFSIVLGVVFVLFAVYLALPK